MSGMPPAPPMSGMPSPAVYTRLDQSLDQAKLEKHILQVEMKAPDKLHTSTFWLLFTAMRVGDAWLNTIYIWIAPTSQAPPSQKQQTTCWQDQTQTVREKHRSAQQQRCNNSANHKYT